ncbi:type IV secretion system protein VirB10 [Bartonella sp. A05]|uniref:type IV secretion system protein VirB10 n=1 Tax=Bartonella sp. A05 TaxID=2967261 RepID=UPI0022A9A14C|nr:type IV secretion system protein VirB10 [Bartonella sp. A05]MCZ2203599.1 type IV secretion system protein VirB10 [Bartonella sp. A05]
MFGDKKGDEINTGLELDHVEPQHIVGDYGNSKLDSESRPVIPGARILLLIMLIAVIVVSAGLTWKAWKIRNTTVEDDEEKEHQQTVQQVIPSYTPRIIQEEPSVIEDVEQTSQNTPPNWSKLIQTTIPSQLIRDSEEIARKRMLNSSLGGSDTGSAHIEENQESNTGTTNDDLFGQLQPVRLNPSRARQLHNRDLIITQGTQLDCVLETKIITTQPGMTTCHLTRNVYSTSGRVVLLDRGSKVVGIYQSGIQQGQTRVFVQWVRVETPSGVIINLDSPGTGPLGESGIGGWVDEHFWKRFGGAIMVSIIGGSGNWLKDKTSEKTNNLVPLPEMQQGAQSVAMETLQNSINITPTLYKNQGERLNIFVARDLDFSDVYALSTH